jgi:hypothetical protein
MEQQAGGPSRMERMSAEELEEMWNRAKSHQKSGSEEKR